MPTVTTRTVGTSPKVAASGVTGLGVGIVVALLNVLAGDSALLGGLPPVLQALILVVIPPVLQYLIPYAAPAGTTEALPDRNDAGWS